MNEMFLSPGFSFWALGGYSFVMVFINGVALYYSYAIVSTLQSIKEFDFRVYFWPNDCYLCECFLGLSERGSSVASLRSLLMKN